MQQELAFESRRAPRSAADAALHIQKLLRRKVSEKERLEKEIFDTQQRMAVLLARSEEVLTIALEIRQLFDEAMRRPGLSARQRRTVEGVRRMLQREGICAPDPGELADDDAEPCDCPYCTAERNDSGTWSAADAGRAAGPTPETPDADHASARTAGGADRDPGLRRLYRDLALHYHPDRASDDDRRDEHEAKMREINEAYHGGDTARLLELSKELGLDIDQVRSASGVLAELMAQYERVKDEVRWLRQSPAGQVVVETRRAKRRGYPTPEEGLEATLDDQRAASTEARDHVARFVAGELSVDELVAGPRGPDDVDDEEPDDPFVLLVDLMAQKLGGIDLGPAARPRPKAQKRRKKRKKTRRRKR